MIRIFLLIVVLLMISACSQDRARQDELSLEKGIEASTAPDGTTTPTPGLISRPGILILADGQLESVRPATNLSFTVGGRISEIRVEAGDDVAVGTVLATINDRAINDSISQAQLRVAQAKTSLAQAELNLETLMSWEPNELVVEVAKANLAVAEANYEGAQEQDSVAANSLIASRVAIDQAQRSVADAQEAYDTAWDPARDWELGDPWRKQALEHERDATTRALQSAEESLAVARANYSLAMAGLDTNNVLNADAVVAGAQQALTQAQTGPTESEIDQARLQVEQATITVEEAEFTLAQASEAMEDVSLVAPWSGTVLAVTSTEGTLVNAGTPVMTLLDTENLQFTTNNLSERDLSAVEPGQSAEITLKAYPGEVILGIVDRISPQAGGMIGDAATFSVIIELLPTNLLLLPGMTGRVEIQPIDPS